MSLGDLVLEMFVDATAWQTGSTPAMAAGENVFWGVVAGFITTILLFILGLLYSRVIRPWYQALTYQGLDLRGHWVQERHSGSTTWRYGATLTQKAHEVSGGAEITKTDPAGTGYKQKFSVSGRVLDGFVSLALQSSDRSQPAVCTALLKVSDRGKRLVGHWVYRSGDDLVETEPVDLRKQI